MQNARRICELLAQRTLQAGEGSLFVRDENNVLGRAGQGLLSKLAALQQLCETDAVDISLEEAWKIPEASLSSSYSSQE